MVVIRPKLGICWSYVAICMYMTNILTVVLVVVPDNDNTNDDDEVGAK